MINYNTILDRAKALIDAIEDNRREMWASSLNSCHEIIFYEESNVDDTAHDATEPNIHEYKGVFNQIQELKESIKATEKAIYDSEPKNHPIWRELGVDPEFDCGKYIDGDNDPDGGWEIYELKYDDDIKVYVEIQFTQDNGRDYSDPIVKNYKSYKDTIKWLRDRGVDEDNEFTDDYMIEESHGFQEIAPFNDGYIINEEKLK